MTCIRFYGSPGWRRGSRPKAMSSTANACRANPSLKAAAIYNEPRGGGDSGRMEDQPHATALTKNEIIRSGLKQGWLPHCVGNRAISPSSRPVTVSPMRGPGWRAQVRDAVMLAFLPSLDPLRVASVCTGALILGAAGLIAGRGAATTAPLTILKSLAPGQRPARRPGR